MGYLYIILLTLTPFIISTAIVATGNAIINHIKRGKQK